MPKTWEEIKQERTKNKPRTWEEIKISRGYSPPKPPELTGGIDQVPEYENMMQTASQPDLSKTQQLIKEYQPPDGPPKEINFTPTKSNTTKGPAVTMDLPEGTEAESLPNSITADFMHDIKTSLTQPQPQHIGNRFLAGIGNVNTGLYNVPKVASDVVEKGYEYFAKGLNTLGVPESVADPEYRTPINKFLHQAVDDNERYAEEYRQKADQQEVGKVTDFIATGVEALPQIAVAAYTGYGTAQSLPNVAPQIAGLLPFGAIAGGNYAREAENEGASLGQQVAYGVAGGAAEMATEVIPLENALTLLKKAGAGELAEEGAKNLLQKYGKTGLQVLNNIISETAQEAIVTPMTQTAKKGIYQGDIPIIGDNGIIDFSQMGEDAYAGFAMSVILSAVGLPFATKANKQANEMIENENVTPEKIQELYSQVVQDTKTGNVINTKPELTETTNNMNNEIQQPNQDVTQTEQEVAPEFQGRTPERDKIGIVAPEFREPNKAPKEEKFEYSDPELEEQHRVNRLTKPKFIDKLKDSASDFARRATRTFKDIDPNVSANAEAIKELVNYPNLKPKTGDNAALIINDIINNEKNALTPEEFNRFERYTFLKDLLADAENGMAMPGKWTPEAVQREYSRLEQTLTPNIKQAIEKRREYWNGIKTEYIETMKGLGFNTENKFTKEDYFRHQVLEYMNAKNLTGSGSRIKANKNRGWTKERKGTEKAINEDYLQAEYEVMANMLYDTEVGKMLNRIENNYSIKKKLKLEAQKENMKAFQKLIEEEKAAHEGISGIEAGYKEAKSKTAYVRNVLGKDYKTFKNVIPEGYSFWQPIPGRHFMQVTAISEQFAEKLLTMQFDEITKEQLEKMKVMAMGKEREGFVIPEGIANTLDDVYAFAAKDNTPWGKWFGGTLGTWKGWQLTGNPRRAFKYNLRNMTSDLDGVIAGAGFKALNPKYITKSAKELYDAMKYMKFSKDMLEWRDRGGFQTLLYAQEIASIGDQKVFRKFMTETEAKSLYKKITERIPIAKTYTEYTRNMTDYREALLRYSSYLYFKDHIRQNGGKPENYGASKKAQIDGLKSVEDKAYQMSKDLLGAYDEVTELGQSLAKYMIPFYRWNEVNFKRYKRIMENAVEEVKLQKSVGDKMAKSMGVAGKITGKSVLTLGKIGIRVMFVYAMLQAWNRLVMKDNDDELPESIRNSPHITLGKNDQGEVIYFSRLGALNDLLEWAGLDTLPQDIKALKSGRKTLGEQAEDMIYSPINKIVSSLNPFLKSSSEIISGKTTFPDIREPKTIRDTGYYIAQQLGLTDEYKALKGLPMNESYLETWMKAFIYTSDPDVTAYYRILDLKRKFEKDTLGKYPTQAYNESPKSQALYYFKLSLKYGDDKKAKKFLKEYINNGGTGEGLVRSLSSLNPVYGLNAQELTAFYEWLTYDEQQDLKKAFGYYQSLIGNDDDQKE